METNKVTKIITEKYECPICHSKWDAQQYAEQCAQRGEWIKEFSQKFIPFRWYYLQSNHMKKYKKWILAAAVKVEREWYSHLHNDSCMAQKLYLCNCIDNAELFDISILGGDWSVLETCLLSDGWEEYGLYVPNVNWKFRKAHPDLGYGLLDIVRNEIDEDIKAAISKVPYERLQSDMYQLFTGIMSESHDFHIDRPLNLRHELRKRVLHADD